MDERELERMQTVARRAWGAALLSTGILLLAVWAALGLFVLWLLSQISL